MNSQRIFILVLAVSIVVQVVIFPVPAYPQITDEKIIRVDQLLSRWGADDEPGLISAIIKDGQIVFEKGYGLSNLDTGARITPHTIFPIASTSKQFTAACILLLEQRGVLSLDNSLNMYFPEFPAFYEPVTIRHMLHNISGVKDYLSLYHLAGHSDDFIFKTADAVELLGKQTSLYYPAGERYLYSNSNYLLLGEIVRIATGKTLRQFAHENIFKPLGMNQTHFHDDNELAIENRASGYRRNSNGFQEKELQLEVVGDGGIFTTVGDLLLWDQAFYNEKFGRDYSQRMTRRGVLNDGSEIDYACGLFVKQFLGRTMVSHGGTDVGHRAEMIRFPEERLTVICLTNRRRIDPTTTCKNIAEILFEK